MSQTITMFVSSPSDVSEERVQCADVVEELNTTLRLLVPDQEVRLELIAWETHTRPALGHGAQAEVDAQIPVDYDIFLGIMWKRFGTPTGTYGSGTESEFRAAWRGWDQGGRPSRLMFYFCEAPVSPAHDDMAQAAAVQAFRDEIRTLGLVGAYDDRARFSTVVRRHLLQVVAEILRVREGAPVTPVDVVPTRTDQDTVRRQVRQEADDYRDLREKMPEGDPRTRRMEVVASRLRSMAQSTWPLLKELESSGEPGERLAAITALQSVPSVEHVDWLADVYLDEDEKPFIGYHAAVALLSAARDLDPDEVPAVQSAVTRAAARSLPNTDRGRTLELAAATVEQRLAARR